MLLNGEILDTQLQEGGFSATEPIYRLLAGAKYPAGITVRPTGHGYIHSELRLERDGAWLCAAVLNKSWVLWYFRKPLLTSLGMAPAEITAVFTGAETTGQNEVKLRLTDEQEVYAVLGWLHQHC